MSKIFYDEPKKVRPETNENEFSDKAVTKVKQWKQDSEGFTSTWQSNQEKFHKLRMRIKKKKTFPFPGCSNIRMPTGETHIRKLKAGIINSWFGIRPVVQCIPEGAGSSWELSRKIEKFLDHLLMDVMKIKQKMVIVVDQELEKGFFCVKPYWRLETMTRIEKMTLDELSIDDALRLYDLNTTEDDVLSAMYERFEVDLHPRIAKQNRQQIKAAAQMVLNGDTEIQLSIQDMIYNFPDLELISPERLYVPTTTGFDPQSAQYCVHEFFLPLNTLKDRANNRGWNKDAVNSIGDKKNKDLKKKNNNGSLPDKTIDRLKDEREGIERLQSQGELVRILEAYCHYDVNNDGQDEKAVITIAPEFNKELRRATLPFKSGRWPIVKFFYELIDDRWFSHRGVIELIEDIIKEIDVQHMQRVDYGTMANSPLFAYRAGMVNPRTVQFAWGQGIPVHGLSPLTDSIANVNRHNPNIDFSFKDEQMFLETKATELMGQVDYTLQSMINKRQPRTLGEVQMQGQTQQLLFSLDVSLQREQFEELINWVWELWCLYGDDAYEFAYFGPEGWEKIRLTREEIQNKVKITVRGNDQNTNPQVRLTKAQMIIGNMLQPAAMQSGVVNPQNIFNAFKRFYQELDIPNWQELISMPQQKPNVEPFKARFSDLTSTEQAQVLSLLGINPDMKKRMSRDLREENNEQIENLTAFGELLNEGAGNATAAG